jgi:hypothetical protein
MQPRWPQIQPTTPAAEHQPKCRGQGLVLLAVGANEARKSIGTFLFEFCAYNVACLFMFSYRYPLSMLYAMNSPLTLPDWSKEWVSRPRELLLSA